MIDKKQSQTKESSDSSQSFSPETSEESQKEQEKSKEKKTASEQKEKEVSKEDKPKKEKNTKTTEGVRKNISSKKKKGTKTTQTKDEVTEEIENIMEEGLEDAYKELTPVQKQEFKIKGEETALKIRNLIRQGKAKVKEIFQLILEWLEELPGVNKFFLEQEAKIKADKIMSVEKKEKAEKDINIKEE